MNCCLCKCRGTPKGKNSKYCQGHNSRVAHPMKGKTHTKKVKTAQSKRVKKQWKDPTYCQLMRESSSKAKKKQWKDPERRQRMSEAASKTKKKQWEDPIYRQYISESMEKIWQDPAHRQHMNKVMSKVKKKQWQDPVFREAQIKVMMKGLHITPNRPELALLSILNSLFPDEWEFTGDGQKKQVCGKAPDFQPIDDSRKLIIEHFGTHWHGRLGDKEKDAKRIRMF